MDEEQREQAAGALHWGLIRPAEDWVYNRPILENHWPKSRQHTVEKVNYSKNRWFVAKFL